MGLLSLPEEVVQLLSNYLSLSDIVSCCKTCNYLRTALNHNLVWKRYLPPEDLSPLESLQQYVQPTFAQNYQSSLYALCSSRHLIMKTMHILNNWTNGNFICKHSKTKLSYSSGVFKKPRGQGKLIYENRYIFIDSFINNVHSDAIELWDVQNEPVLHCSLPIMGIEYDSFFITGDYLVVICCRTVNVYEINLVEKTFPIKYSFIITEYFVSFNINTPHGRRHGHDFNCKGWSHRNVDQYLLSNKCGEDPCVLHVWDILNATKTGTFLSPVQGFSIRFHSKMENAWVLTQSFQSSDELNFLSFNIKNKEFLSDYFKLERYYKHIIFHMNYVLVFNEADDVNAYGWQDTICSLFDFNSSIKLKEGRFINPTQRCNVKSTIIVNGSFIMLCAGCFQLVDAISLEIFETIECSPMLKFITSQYNIFGRLFVLVANSDNSLELWDTKKRSIIPDFLKRVYPIHLYLDDLATKIVYFDSYKIYVAHFW